jgi:hypothetical protein
MKLKSAKSGGGLTMSITKSGKASWKTEPKSKAISPAAVNQMGVSTPFKKEPLVQGRGYETKPMPPTGVPGKYNAATQGPGSQRTAYRTGTQSTYGPIHPGLRKPAPRDILSEYGPEKSKG